MEELSKCLDRAALARFVLNPTVQPQHQWVPAFPDGTASLHSAVLNGNINDVRGLLAAGADATQTNTDGELPVTIARLEYEPEIAHYMESEHDELVRVLGKCLGRTPTQMEIYAVVTLFEMRVFRAEVRDHIESVSAEFIYAAHTGDLATVKRLLESGEIGVNFSDGYSGETAFSAALAQDRRAVYVYLMESGAKIHGVCYIDGKRYSVLAAAVLTSDVGFVRKVVACGAAIVPVGDETTDTCALVEAAKSGSIEMVETLLDLGVRFDFTQRDLQLPKPYVDLFDRIRLSSSTATDAEPWLLLCAACWFEDQQLFQYLIHKYPQLQDQRDKPHYSAVVLVYAVFRQNESMVSELLQRGASIASETSHSAMFAAVMNKSARMLQLLLQYTSDVSAVAAYASRIPGTEGCVLSAAANLDARDCVTLLLPLETRPDYRRQALQWAILRENIEVVAQILDAMEPISERDLQVSVRTAESPVILDLLLSRCGGIDLSGSVLNDEFDWHNHYCKSPDLISVFVAHGFDITHEASGQNATSRAMAEALYGRMGHASPVKLQFMLANGVPLVSMNDAGITPEQELLAQEIRYANPELAQLYEECRAVFSAFSSPVVDRKTRT